MPQTEIGLVISAANFEAHVHPSMPSETPSFASSAGIGFSQRNAARYALYRLFEFRSVSRFAARLPIIVRSIRFHFVVRFDIWPFNRD